MYSQNGVLTVGLQFSSGVDANNFPTYCYTYSDGSQAPTLRLSPGDMLTLNLKNVAPPSAQTMPGHSHSEAPGVLMPLPSPCIGEAMTASTTNVHFHGLNIPPTCHQDEVVNTAIQPGTTFQYRFRVPQNEPPGLYWYHPHPHGFSEPQVLGGATGALIVEGIQRFNPALSGLPERVLVIRDQANLSDPDDGASPDTLAPAKDVSINYVPVTFPLYQPAVISTRPSERQFWRVLNSAADTVLDLQVLYDGKPQKLGVAALDGVPLGWSNGPSGAYINWQTDILIPTASRAEFILDTPAAGVTATLSTRAVNTGPDGDLDPARPLANIVASAGAAEPGPVLHAASSPITQQRFPWLANVAPTAQRKLYFSEKENAQGNMEFYVTVAGQTPRIFDPAAPPDIVTQIGAVEDWTIENRSGEVHEFHMHQIHFQVLEENGVPVNDGVLRDTYQIGF